MLKLVIPPIEKYDEIRNEFVYSNEHILTYLLGLPIKMGVKMA